jgi:DNA-binding transcriptional regulator PaaX
VDADDSTALDARPVRWLLLVYRIPSEPTRLRAGVWRKIKGLGAIYVQNSVAALPSSPASERAFRSLRAEIGELGGVAFLFDAGVIAGSPQLRVLYNEARDDEYDEIVDKCADFLVQVQKEYDALHFTYAELEENDVDLAKLRGWLDKIHGRDVLDASGYGAALEAVGRCEQSLEEYAARVYAEEGDDGPSSSLR